MALCTILQGETRYQAEFSPPQRLSALICKQNIGFAMPCGQNGICGKCAVLASGALSALSTQEKSLLARRLDASPQTRLACMAKALGDCTITLPAPSMMIVTASNCSLSFPGAQKPYGAAVDIGTTTVVISLYDLKKTQLLDTAAFANPQAKFGADVITRVGKALNGQEKALRSAICSILSHQMTALLRAHNVPESECEAVVTGNTAMLYLLTGRDVTPLSCAPFTVTDFLSCTERGLFPTLPSFSVYLPRTVSAFVGSDITCAMLACGMQDAQSATLLADIGTNGEIALFYHGKYYACSTAAGPAFEGGGISCGMAAEEGAIDSVFVKDGRLCCTTIGGADARGICGTGLISAAAALLSLGWMDESGYLEENAISENGSFPTSEGQAAIPLANGVFLSQRDIRNLQLAKAAVCAGIETLLDTAGITAKEVDRFNLAGGFGRFIDLNAAGKIGLFPDELLSKGQAVGNAAGLGAAMLLDPSRREESRRMAERVQTVNLSTSPYFMERYISRMSFAKEEKNGV